MDIEEGELMRLEIRPKTFCSECYEKVTYHIKEVPREVSVREISFKFVETQAICDECGSVVYVPAINDKNSYERHKAYYAKLEEIKKGLADEELRTRSS